MGWLTGIRSSRGDAVVSKHADKFALLFSSDWFRPYLAVSGFVPRRGDEGLFQQRIRSLVSRIIQDADCYWNVSFAETRVAETRSAFLNIMELSASRESKLSLIRAIVDGVLLNDAVVEVSMAFWGDHETTVEAINSASLVSSDWDRYLVGLTPDLPSFLQDFAVVDVLRAG